MQTMPAAAGRVGRYEEALAIAREARYWAERYLCASERVERAATVMEEQPDEGGDPDADD